MDLAQYADNELRLAGFTPEGEDADYGPLVYENVMKTIEAFRSGGHSGGSAMMVADILDRLLRYKPLTPLTYEPDEWIDQTEASGVPMWQNNRDFSVFSNDGGKTHYRLEN